MTTLPAVLTVDQVAELLDCTGDTVETRTRERRLPGVQYGRSWVYPREALLEVLRVQALAHVQPKAADPAAGPQLAPDRKQAPKAVPMGGRSAARQRGRTPAPLPDPPAGPA